jgi:hypothetical protein
VVSQRQGRPAAQFDVDDSQNRNVEQACKHVKNWRGSPPLRHALVYRGGVILAAILLWLA